MAALTTAATAASAARFLCAVMTAVVLEGLEGCRVGHGASALGPGKIDRIRTDNKEKS